MTPPRTPSPQTTEGLGARTAERRRILALLGGRLNNEAVSHGRYGSCWNARSVQLALDIIEADGNVQDQDDRKALDTARLSVPSEALAEAPMAREIKALRDVSRRSPGAVTTVRHALNVIDAILAALPNREDDPEPPDVDRLAFAMEARDVQRGGSPHITPGNRFYREQAAALIALMPPPAREDAPSREGLDAAYVQVLGVEPNPRRMCRRGCVENPDGTWSLCAWHEGKAQWAARETHVHDPAQCPSCAALAATPPGDRVRRIGQAEAVFAEATIAVQEDEEAAVTTAEAAAGEDG